MTKKGGIMKSIERHILRKSILLLVYFLIFLCLSINISLGENVNDTIDRLLSAEYVEGELLIKFNISKAQLPKMFLTDAALPPNCQIGDVVKIEREDSKDNKTYIYYRVII